MSDGITPSPKRTVRDLDDAEVRGRRFLVRVDFNVPLTGEGEVAEAARIDATVPTLEELLDRGGRLVLVSHLGRPKGSPDPAFSLRPVASALAERIDREVAFHPWLPGVDLTAVGGRAAGEEGGLPEVPVVLLENVRFHPGETRNDPELARGLAEGADHFVSDAFGTSHRAHASTVGAAEVIRGRGGQAVAGLLMDRELRYLHGVLEAPDRPFVGILGGAKVSGKLEVIESVLGRVDRLLLGGAMANTFFLALGLEVGRSLVEEELVDEARRIMDEAGGRLILPLDCTVAPELEAGAGTRVVDRNEIGEEDRIADIGPDTRALFRRTLEDARTVVWNGPMGVFEVEPFGEGTMEVARSVAEVTDRGGTTVVGGGDSAAAVRAAGVADRVSHISTGGGASLELLAGKTLPGVQILSDREGEA